jgi:hypothetical protein
MCSVIAGRTWPGPGEIVDKKIRRRHYTKVSATRSGRHYAKSCVGGQNRYAESRSRISAGCRDWLKASGRAHQERLGLVRGHHLSRLRVHPAALSR